MILYVANAKLWHIMSAWNSYHSEALPSRCYSKLRGSLLSILVFCEQCVSSLSWRRGYVCSPLICEIYSPPYGFSNNFMFFFVIYSLPARIDFGKSIYDDWCFSDTRWQNQGRRNYPPWLANTCLFFYFIFAI